MADIMLRAAVRKQLVRFYYRGMHELDPDYTTVQEIDHDDPKRVVIPSDPGRRPYAFRFESRMEFEISEGEKVHTGVCGKKLGRKHRIGASN